MLDLTRIGRGLIDLERTVFDARACVQNAWEVCGPQAEDKGIQVIRRIEADPIPIDGEETRVSQIFTNILNNAIKYTDRNGRVELVLRSVPEDRQAELRVTDNGNGIDPAQLPNVFNMFYQSSPDRRRSAGLGVGLTLVKRLVELHQGKVWVESKGKGKGTTVTVRLPLASTTELTPLPLIPAAAATTGKKVLLVEDDRDSASALTTLLHMAGHAVEHATTGADALASNFTPEVYLLDIGLSDMNGYDLCRRLKSAYPDALFVAMTGHVRPQDQEQARQAGFDAHLPKPVDFDTLQTILSGAGK
jgi:CheY-like chemotaxis protein/anti-sigma regulatory factor (Ser/Thr protein kinase)